MKKHLTILLVLLLCGTLVFGLCACGGEETPEGTEPNGTESSTSDGGDESESTTDQQGTETQDPEQGGDETGEDTGENPGTDPGDQHEPMKKKTFTLSTDMDGIKLFGVRNVATGRGVPLNWAGSGVEMSFYLDNGDFFMTIAASGSAYLRIYVDGVLRTAADGSEYHRVSTATASLTVGDIPQGNHTVKAIRVSDYGDSEVNLTSAIFAGNMDITTKVPAAEYYVEFFGDQFTTGENLNGGERYDASLAYAYKAALTLNADYSITASAEFAVMSGEYQALDIYGLANPIYEKDMKYDFARKANAVVINLGANDLGSDPQEFRMKYLDLLFAVRAANGPDCKIYCIYGEGELAAAIQSACADFGGERAGVYAVEFDGMTAGTPATAAQQEAYAAVLVQKINETKNDVIDYQPKKGGIGVILDWSEGKLPE